MKVIKVRGLIFCLSAFLSACTIHPQTLTVEDRYIEAKEDIKLLFTNEKIVNRHIDYTEALARGIKYNLDYRIKVANSALQAGQLKIAEFTMFPTLDTTGSLYTRDNAYSTFGITAAGEPTGVLTSTPRTLRSLREGMSWNMLDFGMSYIKARQQGERILIAQEEARKQTQQLAQDIRIAYWTAYSAQQLSKDVNEFRVLVNKAKKLLAIAIRDETIPKEQILNYQAALLDGDRHLIQLNYKRDKAMLDLKHLLNLPLDENLILATPPETLVKSQNLQDLDFEKLDAVTLVQRPELRGQSYQERVAKLGVNLAIVQAFPAFTLNYGWNYNSNKFLSNNKWMDRSLDISWNLLNLAAIPANYKTAKIQIKYEKLKLLALTITALTETRYSYSRYSNLSKELAITHAQQLNAAALYKLVKDRHTVALASTQELLLAKLHFITAKMDEQLLMSDASTALGELYLSAGFDILPEVPANLPLNVTEALIRHNFAEQHTMNFTQYVNVTYARLFGTTPAYTLQLSGNYQLALAQKLQKQLAKDTSQTSRIARTKHNGRDWYVVTYGQYASSHEAAAHLKQLPKNIRMLEPWVRKTNDLTAIG